MTLLATRQHLVQFSGRYDLVVDTINWADAGANFFLQEGQKWLDRKSIIPASVAKFRKNLSPGDWFALVPDCRDVQEVWVSNADGNAWKLTKRDMMDMLWYSTDKINTINDTFIPQEIWLSNVMRDPGQLTQGAPINYTPIVVRSMPEVTGVTTVAQFGPVTYSDITQSFWNLDGIMFLPPVLPGFVLEVTGQFYQPKLINDGDMNYWTEREEMTLVIAACREIEITLRNQQGVSDWETAISSKLQGLEYDVVEQESAEITQIRG